MSGGRIFSANLSPDLIALEANANVETPQTIKCSMTESAEELVAATCKVWQIEPEDFHKYCLIFDDTKSYLTEGKIHKC